MIKFIKNIFLSERLHLVQLLWKEYLKIIHILMNKIEPRNDICLVIKYYIKYYKTLILIAKNRLPDIPREFLTWRRKKRQRQKIQKDQRRSKIGEAALVLAFLTPRSSIAIQPEDKGENRSQLKSPWRCLEIRETASRWDNSTRSPRKSTGKLLPIHTFFSFHILVKYIYTIIMHKISKKQKSIQPFKEKW